MSFEFDAGSFTDSLNSSNSLTDLVKDSLAAGHTDDEFRYAYAEVIKAKIGGYAKHQWLARFWFSQSGPLFDIAESDPVLFLDLVDHLSRKLDEIT